MNPRLVSNFASSACAADESSRPIRSCTSPPDSGCSLNLIPSAYYRTSRPQTDFLKPISASSCQAGTAYPNPYRVTNCLESRPAQSVNASANLQQICGFHQGWCSYNKARALSPATQLVKRLTAIYKCLAASPRKLCITLNVEGYAPDPVRPTVLKQRNFSPRGNANQAKELLPAFPQRPRTL